MLIERPILNPYTTTYKGPLSKYHYASSEFDNLLDFLREVTNPDEVYLIDSLDFNYEMPPQNFESYIVGFFGEFGNLQFLKEMKSVDLIPGPKSLIVIGPDGVCQFDYSTPSQLKKLSCIQVSNPIVIN